MHGIGGHTAVGPKNSFRSLCVQHLDDVVIVLFMLIGETSYSHLMDVLLQATKHRQQCSHFW
jgi:hypothetical protein